MKKLLIILTLLIAVGYAFSQTEDHYSGYLQMRSAELEGGDHTPLIYTGSVTVLTAPVRTSWMLLGWTPTAGSREFEIVSLTPAQWTVTIDLEKSGIGDSVGMGAAYFELAYDTIKHPIWIADSSNFFTTGISRRLATSDTIAYSYPLNVGFPCWGRLVFRHPGAPLTDTVIINYRMIGTSRPNGTLEAYSNSNAGISVTSLPSVTGAVSVTNFGAQRPGVHQVKSDSLNGVDTVQYLFPIGTGNNSSDFRFSIVSDTTLDSLNIGYFWQDSSGAAQSVLKPFYFDSAKVDFEPVTYITSKLLKIYGGYPVWGLFDKPDGSLPPPYIPRYGSKLVVYVVSTGLNGSAYHGIDIILDWKEE